MQNLRILSRSGQPLPFHSFSDLGEVGADTMVEYRPLALPNDSVGSIFRVRELLTYIFECANRECADLMRPHRKNPLPSMLEVPCWEFDQCLDMRDSVR